MASVYRKRGGFYVCYIDALGKKHDRPITAETQRQADRFARELERTIERQKFGLDPLPVTSSITLAQLCTWWLDKCAPRGNLAKEKSRLKVHVLEKDLGNLQLHRVDSGVLEQRFLEMEHAGAEPASINKLRSTLGSVYRAARKLKKWTGHNPVRETEPRAVPKGVHVTIRDPAEAAQVLRVLSFYWRDQFATAFYMGLRKGELYALAKTDVNLRDRELTIRGSHDQATTKGKAAAVLPIPAPLVPYLEHALEYFSGPLLFPDRKGRMRKKDTHPEIVLRRALSRAGLVTGYRHHCRRKGCGYKKLEQDPTQRRCPVERSSIDGAKTGVCNYRLLAVPVPRAMTFHGLRHSTATLLLRLGVHIAVVQRILRHANITLTVDLYGHLDLTDMREAMDRIPMEDQVLDAVQQTASAPAGLLPPASSGNEQGPGAGGMPSDPGPVSWSGTPGSNRRPSPWQGTARHLHALPAAAIHADAGPSPEASPATDDQGSPGKPR